MIISGHSALGSNKRGKRYKTDKKNTETKRKTRKTKTGRGCGLQAKVYSEIAWVTPMVCGCYVTRGPLSRAVLWQEARFEETKKHILSCGHILPLYVSFLSLSLYFSFVFVLLRACNMFTRVYVCTDYIYLQICLRVCLHKYWLHILTNMLILCIYSWVYIQTHTYQYIHTCNSFSFIQLLQWKVKRRREKKQTSN